MSVELRIPQVGESISEVEIGEWLKSEGDRVEKDENVAVIETDKATLELPAPVSGTITKILKRQGEKVSVGELIGEMEAEQVVEKKPQQKLVETVENDSGPKQRPEATRKTEAEPTPKGSNAAEPKKTRPPERQAEARENDEREQRVNKKTEELKKTPQAEQRTDAEKEDERRTIAYEKSEEEQTLEREQITGDASRNTLTTQSLSADRQEEFVPMTPLRRRVAERLVEAQRAAALLTTFNEIDMSRVIALRREYGELFQQKHGVKLGYMSFFVKASIEALKHVPQVNTEIRGDAIVYRNYYDIGVAVGGGRGLVVPVLRSADRMSLAEIEMAIGDFAHRAGENKLTLEELRGGTFTISNGGIYGSLLSTPIVNPPQSGILGMHAIQERPVARNGSVVIRPMMYVALTYDHRIIDGREAVTFLKDIKELIEEPARMLLEI